MRKSKEELRLRHVFGLGVREIGRSLQVSATTVSNCLERANAAGLSWPLPEAMGDDELERRLYPEADRRDQPKGAMLSMQYLHRELKRSKGVTLKLLWEE
jgi:transposase